MSARWVALASLLCLGCSSSAEPESETSGAAGAAGEASCAGRGQPLAPAQTLSAAQDVEVELISLEPQVPVVGDNVWQLRISRAGEPLEAATLSVLPWMPDHEHASTKTVQVTEPDPGRYRLAPVYLGMVGYWEVGIDIVAAGEGLGSVSLDTCLNRE